MYEIDEHVNGRAVVRSRGAAFVDAAAAIGLVVPFIPGLTVNPFISRVVL